MKFFKLATAAALVAASLSASAMTAINDEQLSAVSGQDGVSIVADLNINIGAFTYKDTDSTGGSVSFNNILINGMMTMEIDVINKATFTGDVVQGIARATGADLTTTAGQAATGAIAADVATAMGYVGQDVVQFAFPAATNSTAAHAATPTITVSSITTGNTTADASGHVASFGSLTIQNLDLQGTKVWLFAH